jgi:hypothetical protein
MELLCIEVMVSNGNFEILSQNFSSKPGYTLCEFSEIVRDPQLKSEF